MKQLTAALKNEDRAVRGMAVVSLGEKKDQQAVKPLIAELKDSDPYIRALASDALIKIGPPAVEPLIGALKDKDPDVPRLAAVALRSIKDPRATDALMRALQDHNSTVISGIHTYYVKLGLPGSEGAMIEALNKFPSRRMADEFLNSGNPVLAEAAKTWAIKYKQTLEAAPAGSAVKWGSAQPQDAEPATAANPAASAAPAR